MVIIETPRTVGHVMGRLTHQLCRPAFRPFHAGNTIVTSASSIAAMLHVFQLVAD